VTKRNIRSPAGKNLNGWEIPTRKEENITDKIQHTIHSKSSQKRRSQKKKEIPKLKIWSHYSVKRITPKTRAKQLQHHQEVSTNIMWKVKKE